MNLDEILKLDNQLCFALYSANRTMTKVYKPLLDKYSLTYPQYLVLLVLFEEDNMMVKKLGDKLYLDSGTLTPLLKRMESAGFIKRKRSKDDERKVFILLSQKSKELKESLAEIPLSFCKENEDILENIINLRNTLTIFTKKLRHV